MSHEAPTFEDQRSEPRRRVLFEGLLVGAGGRIKLSCMVRDMSPSGARIYISEAVQIPETFEFSITGQQRRWSATVRWRKGGFVGLKLRSAESAVQAATLAAAPAAPTSLPAEGTTITDLLARIDELEHENQRLRKKLRELRSRYEP
jgi:hypothetical protein